MRSELCASSASCKCHCHRLDSPSLTPARGLVLKALVKLLPGMTLAATDSESDTDTGKSITRTLLTLR